MNHAWEDIGYFCETEPCPEAPDHVLDFKVYEILWKEPDGTFAFDREGSIGSDPVLTTSEAQVYLSGGIKWDGCSNMHFDEQDRVMLHFFSKREAMNTGVLLGRLYDLAAKLIPAWSE